MEEYVTSDLKAEKVSPFHEQILTDSKALVKRSRDKMRTYYDQWDRNALIFRGLRAKDAEDVKARERDEPEKMVVPTAFSQIQTFVSFCYSLFTQRERMFELVGIKPEDDRPAKAGEALLARDLRHNIFEAILEQFLLNIARFGLGIMKIGWTTETQMVRETTTTQPISVFGIKLTNGRTITQEAEKVKYQGNKIISISPYRFLPDPRFPIVRFQEGEFVASEDIYSMSTLKQWEKEGKVAGVDFIKPLGKDYYAKEYAGARYDMLSAIDNTAAYEPGAQGKDDGQIKNVVILTELQRIIIPNQYEVDGKKLSDDDTPTKYNIWIANNSRVIKCEPLGYVHDQFTYVVSPFLYDDTVHIPDGLSDTISMLQDVITWFINSRITNVRKVIQDKLVVKEQNIEMDDIRERRSIIRLKQSHTGEIDRSLKQLDLHDVTANHIGDAKFLQDTVQTVTGINDALLGQFQPGRRPATEHRNFSSGSASRLKTGASIIYWVSLEPMARQMISNLRDGLDEESFVRILGMEGAQEAYGFVGVNKDDLVGNYDFEVFDGTLPSERFYTAQALEEVLAGLMKNPEAAVLFQLDPRKIMREIMILRGIRNPERFRLDNVNNPLPILGATPPGAANPNGQPVPPGPTRGTIPGTENGFAGVNGGVAS